MLGPLAGEDAGAAAAAELVGVPARRALPGLLVHVLPVLLGVFVGDPGDVLGRRPGARCALGEAPGVALLAAPVAPGLVDGEVLLRRLVGVGVDEPEGGVALPPERDLARPPPHAPGERQAAPLIEALLP